MSRLPSVNPDDCIKTLEKVGFYVSRQRGSHVQMRRNDATGMNYSRSNQQETSAARYAAVNYPPGRNDGR